MQVFMSKGTRSVLASAAIMAGIVMVQGNPIGQVAAEIDDDIDFFVPQFFKDWSARSVICPEVGEDGKYTLKLLTDDGDEISAELTTGGWNIKMQDVSGEEPVITWFERFC